jgi:hypothetical protein
MPDTQSSPNQQSPEAIIREVFGKRVSSIHIDSMTTCIVLHVTYDPQSKHSDQNYVSSIIMSLDDTARIKIIMATEFRTITNSIDSEGRVTQTEQIIDQFTGKVTKELDKKISGREKVSIINAVYTWLDRLYPAMRMMSTPLTKKPTRPVGYEKQVALCIALNQRRLG